MSFSSMLGISCWKLIYVYFFLHFEICIWINGPEKKRNKISVTWSWDYIFYRLSIHLHGTEAIIHCYAKKMKRKKLNVFLRLLLPSFLLSFFQHSSTYVYCLWLDGRRLLFFFCCCSLLALFLFWKNKLDFFFKFYKYPDSAFFNWQVILLFSYAKIAAREREMKKKSSRKSLWSMCNEFALICVKFQEPFLFTTSVCLSLAFLANLMIEMLYFVVRQSGFYSISCRCFWIEWSAYEVLSTIFCHPKKLAAFPSIDRDTTHSHQKMVYKINMRSMIT